MKTKMFVLICAMMAAGMAHAHQNADATQREAFHQALEACHTETGVVRPSRGSALSREDHEKIKACMSAKGLTLPDHPPRREHRRPAEEGASAVQ